jgi:hypothetical protein
VLWFFCKNAGFYFKEVQMFHLLSVRVACVVLVVLIWIASASAGPDIPIIPKHPETGTTIRPTGPTHIAPEITQPTKAEQKAG